MLRDCDQRTVRRRPLTDQATKSSLHTRKPLGKSKHLESRVEIVLLANDALRQGRSGGEDDRLFSARMLVSAVTGVPDKNTIATIASFDVHGWLEADS